MVSLFGREIVDELRGAGFVHIRRRVATAGATHFSECMVDGRDGDEEEGNRHHSSVHAIRAPQFRSESDCKTEYETQQSR